MYISDELSVASIGSSCMNNFQLEFNFGEGLPTGFFDWIIISPQSTIDVLNMIKDGTALEILTNPSNYRYALNKPKLINSELLYLWHQYPIEDEADFTSKWSHIITNFLSMRGKKRFLWSNIQPNLYIDMGDAEEDMAKFYLTKDKYYEIKSLLKELFDGECAFISRIEDIDSSIAHMDDVHIVELERSIDSRGPKDLYSSIVSGMR